MRTIVHVLAATAAIALCAGQLRAASARQNFASLKQLAQGDKRYWGFLPECPKVFLCLLVPSLWWQALRLLAWRRSSRLSGRLSL